MIELTQEQYVSILKMLPDPRRVPQDRITICVVKDSENPSQHVMLGVGREPLDLYMKAVQLMFIKTHNLIPGWEPVEAILIKKHNPNKYARP